MKQSRPAPVETPGPVPFPGGVMRAELVTVLVLAVPTTAAANVPVVYRPGDPGYERAVVADRVAPIATLAALVTGLAWFARSRGVARATAVLVLVVFLLVAAFIRLGAITRIEGPESPDDAPGGPGALKRFELRPRPGSVSGDEVTLYAAVASIALAGCGIVAARRSNRPIGRVASPRPDAAPPDATGSVPGHDQPPGSGR